MKKLIMLMAAWSSFAAAQDTLVDEAADDAGPRPRYTVEVIIFAYTEDASVGSEIFVADPPPADEVLPLDEDGNPVLVYEDQEAVDPDEDTPSTWIVVPPADEQVTENRRMGSEDSYEMTLLQQDQMQLGNVIRRFELLDAYETLMHFGWTQPAFPEEETPPIDLQLFGKPPPGLAGTLTLYLSRYLHLIVDLALDAPTGFVEETIEEETVPSFGDDRLSYSDTYREFVMPVRFRIQEDRILKNGELRYFDHPKFGVLAKVTRIEEPDDVVSNGENPDPADSPVQ